MHKTFEDLLVKDDADLRDPERIRRLNRKLNFGTWTAVAFLLPMGVACLALGALGVYIKLRLPSAMPQTGWSLMGVGFFFGVMMLTMARAFYREAHGCALAGYLREPQRYDFARGEITGAHYSYGGNRASASIMVKGTYGDGGLFYDVFDASAWSAAIADKGEAEGLRPGDDWYSEKGKRVSLPLGVWVIHEIGGRKAAIVGIPEDVAARLLPRIPVTAMEIKSHPDRQ